MLGDVGNKVVRGKMSGDDQTPLSPVTCAALLNGDYTNMSVIVMVELLNQAAQVVTFNAWVEFAGDRIFHRRRMTHRLRIGTGVFNEDREEASQRAASSSGPSCVIAVSLLPPELNAPRWR